MEIDCVVDGIKFTNQIQSKRYMELKNLVKIATIRDLEIIKHGYRVVGFRYYDYRINKEVKE